MIYLSFGMEFNKPINSLPPFLTHLRLGKNFAERVYHLPLSLETLLFEGDKPPFPPPLSQGIRTLKIAGFRGFFNALCLPPSLTNIQLSNGSRYQEQCPPLPSSLLKLEFKGYWRTLNDELPPSLNHLSILNDCTQKVVDRLPLRLTHLVFDGHFDKLVDHLPSQITHLTLGLNFNQSVDHLPPQLTHLTFGVCFNNAVNHLPSQLILLTFGDRFNQAIDHLPSHLTHLTLGFHFNHSIANLPRHITHLAFDHSKHSLFLLPHCLPYLPHLTHLTLTLGPHPIYHLPSHLSHLTICSDNFVKQPTTIIVPDNIRKVRFECGGKQFTFSLWQRRIKVVVKE